MKKHTFNAHEEEKGLRIDQFLNQKVENLSRNQARKILQKGGVYLGRRRLKICSYRVKGTEEITVYVPEPGDQPAQSAQPAQNVAPARSECPQKPDHPVQPTHSEEVLEPAQNPIQPRQNGSPQVTALADTEPRFADKDIIFLDKSIIAINKPAGIPAQATRSSNSNTAGKLLENYLRSKGESNHQAILIHRIDQNTSGIMIFSRNKQANISLTNQFKKHSIVKNYLAVVSGTLDKERGEIVSRLSAAEVESASGDDHDEKPDAEARLDYEILERFSSYLWLKVTPKTGKTHQVRIQLASKSLPVLGDIKYGGEDLNNFLARHPHWQFTIDPYRFLLHSYSMTLIHPATNACLEIAAPIPDDMKEILTMLRNY